MTSLLVLKLLAVAVQIMVRDAMQATAEMNELVWQACVNPGGAR